MPVARSIYLDNTAGLASEPYWGDDLTCFASYVKPEYALELPSMDEIVERNPLDASIFSPDFQTQSGPKFLDLAGLTQLERYETCMERLQPERACDWWSWFRVSGVTSTMLDKYQDDDVARQRIWDTHCRWSSQYPNFCEQENLEIVMKAQERRTPGVKLLVEVLEHDYPGLEALEGALEGASEGSSDSLCAGVVQSLLEAADWPASHCLTPHRVRSGAPVIHWRLVPRDGAIGAPDQGEERHADSNLRSLACGSTDLWRVPDHCPSDDALRHHAQLSDDIRHLGNPEDAAGAHPRLRGGASSSRISHIPDLEPLAPVREEAEAVGELSGSEGKESKLAELAEVDLEEVPEDAEQSTAAARGLGEDDSQVRFEVEDPVGDQHLKEHPRIVPADLV
eukprot:s537_g8.t1